MKFTNDEMYFLNRISGGGVLFGIHLHKPGKQEGKETAEALLQSLKEKRMLESEEKLSMQGAKYVHAIRKYREARQHIVCNRIYAAQVSEEEAVVILAIQDGYDVYRMPVAALACLLVERCPGMESERKEELEADARGRNARGVMDSRNAPEVVRGRNVPGAMSGKRIGEPVDLDVVLAEMARAQEILTLGSFMDFKEVEEYVYYALEQKLYRYDVSRGRKKQVSGKEIRCEVAEILMKEWRKRHGSSDQCRG